MGASAFAHLATILGSFFKALLGFGVAPLVPGSWDDRSPIMPVQHPVNSAFGDLVPNQGFKGPVDLTHNQNAAL